MLALRGLLMAMVGLLPMVGGAAEGEPVAVVGGDAPTTATLAGLRIGFVDMDEVIARSVAVQGIIKELDAGLERQQREIDRKRLEANRLRDGLQQQGTILSQEERIRRQEQARELLREVDEMEFRLERELRERRSNTVDPVLGDVLRMVTDVARREEFDLVLRGEVVLYGRGSVNLTPKVIAEVDEREAELRERVPTATPTAAATTEALPLLP